MRSRIVVELAVLGGLGLALTLPTWVSGTVSTVTADVTVSVSGAVAMPAVGSAAGILLLAALALTTARLRSARVIAVGAGIIALLGAGSAVFTIMRAEEVLLSAQGGAELQGAVSVSVVAYICAAVLGAAAGVCVLAFLGAPKWNYSRTRFDSGAASSSDPRVRAMDDWDALTAGEDPSGASGENR